MDIFMMLMLLLLLMQNDHEVLIVLYGKYCTLCELSRSSIKNPPLQYLDLRSSVLFALQGGIVAVRAEWIMID
jgi:hypothetical protein